MASSSAVRRQPDGPSHSYTAPYNWASRCATCTLHILEIDALAEPASSGERVLEVVVPRGSRSIHHAVCVAGTKYAPALVEEGALELRFRAPCACGTPVDLSYLTPDGDVAESDAICVLAVPRERHVRMFHRACIDARLAVGVTAEVPAALYTFLLTHCTADVWARAPVANVLVGAHSVGEPHSPEGDLPVGVIFTNDDLARKYRDAAARHPALKELVRSAVLVVPHHESAWLDGPEGAAAIARAGIAAQRAVVGNYTLVHLASGLVRPSSALPRSVVTCPYLRLTPTTASCAAVHVPGVGDTVPVFW